MSERDRLLLLEDMLEAALKIKHYTLGYNLEDFLTDEKTKDAVIRNFEIIGEAAGRVDEEFKSFYPELAWSHLRGFRNRIVHEYFGIDYEIVWTIIECDLTTYIDWLETYLSKEK
jgi:uncharacterized protein with HEPN domain